MLNTLIGDYPVRSSSARTPIASSSREYQGSVATAFKRVVRNLEFDVAEMAIMTLLIAKAHGKPYRLLPFVVLARFQHPFLVYNTTSPLAPEDWKASASACAPTR